MGMGTLRILLQVGEMPLQPGIATPCEWGWAPQAIEVDKHFLEVPGIATPREWGWAQGSRGVWHELAGRAGLESLRPVNGDGQGKL